jgi:hypothetical protein
MFNILYNEMVELNSCRSINGLFAQSQRYAQKIILGILHICLRLFFSHALILNKNPHLWIDINYGKRLNHPI